MQKYFPEIFFCRSACKWKKEILEVIFDKDFNLDNTDVEMLQDVIVVAINDALKS